MRAAGRGPDILAMLMKILAVIAGLAFLTAFSVLGVIWWRLRRHLRTSDPAFPHPLAEVPAEQEPTDKR